ncbi:hypothetical protein B0H14DRAFT_2628097 [Mycena olivaceomarginata]|nr:hypothetical protein B0H14DRAFT_2628097 [Mycena olivaceomarginata]
MHYLNGFRLHWFDVGIPVVPVAQAQAAKLNGEQCNTRGAPKVKCSPQKLWVNLNPWTAASAGANTPSHNQLGGIRRIKGFVTGKVERRDHVGDGAAEARVKARSRTALNLGGSPTITCKADRTSSLSVWYASRRLLSLTSASISGGEEQKGDSERLIWSETASRAIGSSNISFTQLGWGGSVELEGGECDMGYMPSGKSPPNHPPSFHGRFSFRAFPHVSGSRAFCRPIWGLQSLRICQIQGPKSEMGVSEHQSQEAGLRQIRSINQSSDAIKKFSERCPKQNFLRPILLMTPVRAKKNRKVRDRGKPPQDQY